MKTSAIRGEVPARQGDIRELALHGIGPRVLLRQLERANAALTDVLAGKTPYVAGTPLAGAARPEDFAHDLAAAAHDVACMLGRPEVDESTKRWWHEHVVSAYRDLLGYNRGGIGACRLLADILDVLHG